MQTFINLPVKDLDRATEFFRTIGFSFDPVFTDENVTRMIVSDDTSVMLAVEPFFQGFIQPQEVADTSRSRKPGDAIPHVDFRPRVWEAPNQPWRFEPRDGPCLEPAASRRACDRG